MAPFSSYTFGPFCLDERTRALTREGQPVPLDAPGVDVLLHLVSHAGEVVPKDALIEAAGGARLDGIMTTLRRALGGGRGKKGFIETVPRRGYRFTGQPARAASRPSNAELAGALESHRVWLDEQLALDAVDPEALRRVQEAFGSSVADAPEYAPAHIGLATAYVLQFDATRIDDLPDADALLRADHHAREACRLDARSADAWAALALVLHRSGLSVQAIAAARRAVILQPDDWRYHFRLSYVAWGEERLRAAQRTLALSPGLAAARWLAATVHVARQAFQLAEEELGAAAHNRRGPIGTAGMGIGWLLGLVRLARGDEREALDALRAELADGGGATSAYARERGANTWYAIGGLMLRQGRRADAAGAFQHALERVPTHLMAMVGLATTLDPSTERDELHAEIQRRVGQLADAGFVVEAAVGRAGLMIGSGAPSEAAPVLDEALAAAPVGSAGWTIPVDPLLNIPARAPAFANVLARLRTRAA